MYNCIKKKLIDNKYFYLKLLSVLSIYIINNKYIFINFRLSYL